MQYAIVTFRSRNQTARIYDVFCANGVPAKIINTPREANVGCGISIRFDMSYLGRAKMLVNRYPQSSFVGFFKITVVGGRYLAKYID